MCGSRRETISIPPHGTGYWKLQGGRTEGLEVQISKGCKGEKSNVFPEGPRALSEGNLPMSHLQFD